ncbi:MAG: FHA domain-containing protein, partial [Planctomycetota bacterium]
KLLLNSKHLLADLENQPQNIIPFDSSWNEKLIGIAFYLQQKKLFLSCSEEEVSNQLCQWLKKITGYEYSFSKEEIPEETEAFLYKYSGKELGFLISLSNTVKFTVGRAWNYDLTVSDDVGVGRLHFSIKKESNPYRYIIVHSGTGNPTFVNHQAIVTEMVLKNKDFIQIGRSTRFLFLEIVRKSY